MKCPYCGTTMKLNELDFWHCLECDYSTREDVILEDVEAKRELDLAAGYAKEQS